MSAKDYKGIRPAARRAGVRTRIVKKRGAPFYAARYRGRIGIPIGAALGIALLIFLSNFIWTIHISGAEHVSEQRLLRFLSESGIKVGAFRNAADARQAKRDVLLKVDELGWMSVNIIGSHAEIEVRESRQRFTADVTVDRGGEKVDLKEVQFFSYYASDEDKENNVLYWAYDITNALCFADRGVTLNVCDGMCVVNTVNKPEEGYPEIRDPLMKCGIGSYIYIPLNDAEGTPVAMIFAVVNRKVFWNQQQYMHYRLFADLITRCRVTDPE